jgi:microcompartment protein CcmL/EutN
VIPNVHESVFPAIGGAARVEHLEALGILESFSVASLIEGADAAVKSANVRLIELRLAMALGGKAFVTLTGSVAAVTSAIDAGARAIAQKGLLVNKVVIPSPRPELLGDTI